MEAILSKLTELEEIKEVKKSERKFFWFLEREESTLENKELKLKVEKSKLLLYNLNIKQLLYYLIFTT